MTLSKSHFSHFQNTIGTREKKILQHAWSLSKMDSSGLALQYFNGNSLGQGHQTFLRLDVIVTECRDHDTRFQAAAKSDGENKKYIINN